MQNGPGQGYSLTWAGALAKLHANSGGAALSAENPVGFWIKLRTSGGICACQRKFSETRKDILARPCNVRHLARQSEFGESHNTFCRPMPGHVGRSAVEGSSTGQPTSDSTV